MIGEIYPILTDDVIADLSMLSPRLIRRTLLEACAKAALRVKKPTEKICINNNDLNINRLKSKRGIGFV